MNKTATYPVSVIAKLLTLTERRVQQLTKEGVIPKAERGRYELVPAVQGYIKYLKDRAIGADISGGDEDHKRRLIKARADIAEMESERLASNLVEVDKIEKSWAAILTRLKAKLLSVAPKAAPLVSVETTTDNCHYIINKFINEALTELSVSEFESENQSSSDTSSISERSDEDFITATGDDGDGMGRSIP